MKMPRWTMTTSTKISEFLCYMVLGFDEDCVASAIFVEGWDKF
jgi:hypothetical protein